MPTIHLEASVSPDDLLRAAEQLASAELERFASQVFALLAHRRAPSLSREETDLLQAINEGLPPEVAERYAMLIDRRDEGTLTPEEHAELLRIGDEVELRDARRAEHLVELARVRGVSLDELMETLGIRARDIA
ncbi:MAG: hypothetical protein U0359_30580 [Byssovorax sp.]